MMETWVLIPPELSLVLQSNNQALVMTRVPVAQGRRWSPFQGTVRLGVIPASAASEPDNEVRALLHRPQYKQLKAVLPMAIASNERVGREMRARPPMHVIIVII